jgi:hypothetical protein
MQITHTYIKAHALSNLKRAQSAFNKHPSSSNWCALTSAMLVHQQITSARLRSDIDHLCEKLTLLPLGNWPETIVRHTTGLTIKEVLAFN